MTNKEVVQNLYQALNKRNIDLLQGFISEDYVGKGDKKGVPEFKEHITALINAFPDANWEIKGIFAEGDKVLVIQQFQGTHTNKFQNFAETGRKVSVSGVVIYEFENGQIINSQVQTDRLEFLQQLGVLPSDLSLLSNKKADENRVIFIDKFIVPQKAEQEFIDRMNINRDFIKNLPGFIEDNAYVSKGGQEKLTYITVAVWENENALKKAKEAVQTEYKKRGFNPAEMIKRLSISMDRGTYIPSAETVK